MPKFLTIIIILVVILALLVLITILLLPWMDRWGTSDTEIDADLPGDDLLPDPPRVTNRSVTIDASPEAVYPWLAQMSADKSGMYSYTWLENLVGCKMAEVHEIRAEWQDPQPGDLMKMCAKDPAPPPYVVAQVFSNQAIVFYHRDADKVADSWAFVLLPQPDGSTHLVSRTRTTMIGGMWEVIRPITFVMERKMLLTIKRLSER
jgi:hypothetical protein